MGRYTVALKSPAWNNKNRVSFPFDNIFSPHSRVGVPTESNRQWLFRGHVETCEATHSNPMVSLDVTVYQNQRYSMAVETDLI
ncbi:hypothetical protein CEXT_625531 [Caerostris extrusa]|uniref:Uncharacterized protein n=1 Tax=Caerostris extrusa TaxID=172846 RepID=A0AAV4URL7_CAEEX|nr:hypothetical protein CEXT_625531 [Caerostris extrusa]